MYHRPLLTTVLQMYSYDKYHHKLANDYNSDFFVSTTQSVNNLMGVRLVLHLIVLPF